jgi:hypothetical protein
MSDSQEEINESGSQKVENMASSELVKAIKGSGDFSHGNHFKSLVNFLTTQLADSIHTREWYFNELQLYRNNYITNGIYDIVSNDVFVDNGQQDFLNIKVDKYPEVEEELTKMISRLNLASVLVSILPELLHYGSYSLRPVLKEGVGVIDIVDDLDSRQVTALTDSKGMPLMFFVANQLPIRSDLSGVNAPYQVQANNSRKTYEYLDITELIHFTLDLNFARLVLPDREMKQIRRSAPGPLKKLLPSTLKVKNSQSFIWPALDKLKEVLLLDKLSVYRDIGSIMTPNLVGIPVPDVFDANQLIEIVKKYDELLNSNVIKLNNTQNMEITLQELAAVKVVPVVGDKSTPTAIDIGRSQPISSSESLNEGINRMLQAIGIPKELFDGTEDSKSNMKTNIRYAKKIKKIQKNITRSIQLICLLHISEKFPHLDVKNDDIRVQLKNNTNIDELENMEAQDLLVASITSVKTLVNELEDLVAKSSYEINVDEVVASIVENFSSIGSRYQSMFRKRENKTTPHVFTNDQGTNFTPAPEYSEDRLETPEEEQTDDKYLETPQAQQADQSIDK